jgi:hypothetical protein
MGHDPGDRIGHPVSFTISDPLSGIMISPHEKERTGQLQKGGDMVKRMVIQPLLSKNQAQDDNYQTI